MYTTTLVLIAFFVTSKSETTAKFRSNRLSANLYISTTQHSNAGWGIRASGSVSATEWEVISPGLAGGNTVSFRYGSWYLTAIGGSCYASSSGYTNGEASWRIDPQSEGLIKMNNQGPGSTGKWMVQANKAVGTSTYSTDQDATWQYIVTTPTPTVSPTTRPTNIPTIPSLDPTKYPSITPTETTQMPSNTPTVFTSNPSSTPSKSPTQSTQFPTINTLYPTRNSRQPSTYTNNPTNSPTQYTNNPSNAPTMNPVSLPGSKYIFCDLYRYGPGTDAQCLSFKSWLDNVILTDVDKLFVGNDKGYRITCNDRNMSRNILRKVRDYDNENGYTYNCDSHTWYVENFRNDPLWDGTIGVDGEVTQCYPTPQPLFVWRPCYTNGGNNWGGYNVSCSSPDAVMCIGYEPIFVDTGSAEIINCFGLWNIIFIVLLFV